MSVQKINIAICDDEKAEIDYLTNLINKWAASNKIISRISDFNSAECFLFHYADNKDYDFILLDIQMGNINGIELAHKLREENSTVQIIFITGFPDYISEGYDVNALHYLMKPVKEEKLFEILTKAALNISESEKSLFLTTDCEMHRIPLSSIRYIEAQGHYIIVKTNSGVHKTKMSLSETEKSLDNRFFRCQRSFIVNLAFIKKITRTFITLDDNTEIPLSRGLYDTANRAVIEYFP